MLDDHRVVAWQCAQRRRNGTANPAVDVDLRRVPGRRSRQQILDAPPGSSHVGTPERRHRNKRVDGVEAGLVGDVVAVEQARDVAVLAKRLKQLCLTDTAATSGPIWSFGRHPDEAHGRHVSLGAMIAAPTVSVILCVRNAAATVAEQVAALSAQDHPSPWELVLVDNGSTDATVEAARGAWTHPSASFRVVRADERAGLAYARNVGVAAANGAAVAFCDGDDVADPGWVAALHRALQTAAVAGGHLEVDQLNAELPVYWRGGSPTRNGLPPAHGYLPHAIGANMAVRRDVYLGIGGCDEQFTICSDDVDLCWRLQEAGERLAFAPDAVMHYRLRPGLRDSLRQQWRYGVAEGALKRKYGVRMRRDSAAVFRTVWLTLLLRPDRLVRGHKLRGWWLNVAAYRLGRIAGARRYRVSWW